MQGLQSVLWDAPSCSAYMCQQKAFLSGHLNLRHCAGDTLWWPEQDTKLLKGTRLGAAAEHHARNTQQLGLWQQQLCELQAESGGPATLQGGCGGWAMTDEALRWAKSTVWSRAFNIPYLGVMSTAKPSAQLLRREALCGLALTSKVPCTQFSSQSL